MIAVARGADKLEAAKAAGADHLIDAKTQDIREAVKALGGADVVYDPVGGDQFEAAFRACNPEARILIIGFASGDVPRVKPNHMLVKNIDLLGFYWGGYLKFRPEVITRSLATLFAWYEAGKIKPHVSHVLPLEQAGEGLELLRSRASTGNLFWLYQLEGATVDARRIPMLRFLLSDYTQTTPADLQALAQKYFGSREGWRLAVIPQGQEVVTASGGEDAVAGR